MFTGGSKRLVGGRGTIPIEDSDESDVLVSPGPRVQPLAVFPGHSVAHQPGHAPGHLVTLVHHLTLARAHWDILALLLVNLQYTNRDIGIYMKYGSLLGDLC